MKRTLILTMILGLSPLGQDVATAEEPDSDRTWAVTNWVKSSDVKNFEFAKDSKLIISLGTDGTEVDLGGKSLWNKVIFELDKDGKKSGAINPEAVADDANAAVKTYTYGSLQLADHATVRLSKQGELPSEKEYSKYTSVGTLGLGAGATLTLSERQLEITGLPYVSLGKNAAVVLAARDTSVSNPSGGVLSMGATSVSGADAVVVKGVNGGEGRITNTSNTVAELGGSNATNVEYRDVNIKVQGTQSTTTIVAKLGNAAIYNQTSGGEIILSGGAVEGMTAVTQISTGYTAQLGGGNVTLLNRGNDAQQMDDINIGERLTVTTRRGDAGSEAGLIRMNAYRSELAGKLDGEGDGVYGLSANAYAMLDSDLELGTGNKAEAVLFAPTLELAAYGETDMTFGLGLDMVGNDVTIKPGVLMLSWHIGDTPEVASEYLLFSNVDSLTLVNPLTLGSETYDGRYFDYTEGFAAADYFSSDTEDVPPWYSSIAKLQKDSNGDDYGWFLEYREGTGENGNVYLAYRPAGEAIPEPTTATLSLLALVGLAARRRRK